MPRKHLSSKLSVQAASFAPLHRPKLCLVAMLWLGGAKSRVLIQSVHEDGCKVHRCLHRYAAPSCNLIRVPVVVCGRCGLLVPWEVAGALREHKPRSPQQNRGSDACGPPLCLQQVCTPLPHACRCAACSGTRISRTMRSLWTLKKFPAAASAGMCPSVPSWIPTLREVPEIHP